MRIEERRWWTITDPAYLASLNPTGAWRTLSSMVMVERERTIGGVATCETHYYLASLAEAAAVGRAVRLHWGIENKVHWVLDIVLREDECRVREGHSAQNVAILRHIALTLLRQDRTAKLGIKAKRLRAGWDEARLLKCLVR